MADQYEPEPHIEHLPAQNTRLTPEQLQEWIDAPGTIYIVYLPSSKSFVIKVPDEQHQFFVEFMRHLRKQLGNEVQAQSARPVEAPQPARPAKRPTILDRFRRRP